MGRYKNDGAVSEQLKEAAKTWQEGQGGSRWQRQEKAPVYDRGATRTTLSRGMTPAYDREAAIQKPTKGARNTVIDQQREEAQKEQERLAAYNWITNPGLSRKQIERGIERTQVRKGKEEATRLYEEYLNSPEYAEKKDKADTPTTLRVSPQVKLRGENQEANEYKNVVAYYENQEDALEDRYLMEDDLEEYASWDEDAKKIVNDFLGGKALAILLRENPGVAQKYGEQRIREMAESLWRSRNQKAAKMLTQDGQALANDGFWGSAIGTGEAIGDSLISTVSAPLTWMEEGRISTGRYHTLDPNAGGRIYSQRSNAIINQVAENIEHGNGFLGDLGAWAYRGSVGAADNLLRIAVGGGTSVGTLGLMAVGSFDRTLADASARGASPGEAVLTATAGAGIEVLTEKIGLDELFKAGKNGVKGAKQFITAALKQGGVEATEEEIAFLGNLVVEAAVLREKSAYNQQIGELVANGMSYDQAKNQANLGLWKEALGTAVTSLFSGSAMYGSTALMAKNQYRNSSDTEAGNPLTAGDTNAPGKNAEQEIEDVLVEGLYQLRQKNAPREAVQEQLQTTERNIFQEAANELLGVEPQKNTASEDAVTVVSSGKSAISESNREKNTLAYTLATNIDAVRDMEPVAKLSGNEINEKRVQLSDQIRNFFQKVGGKVFRHGFGDVVLDEYGVGGVLNHRPVNRAKVLSLAAVPDVIQKGRQIGYDPNWKGRGYESFIFAAPVNVGGTDVYVAAVVNRLPDNKFYLSEMVDSQGNYVRIEKSPSGNSKNGLPMGPEDQQGRGYAGPEGLSEEGNPSAYAEPTPSPNVIIPGAGANVNGENAAIPAGFEAMGAASHGFTGKDGYYDALYEGNIQRQRKGDVRDTEVPIKDTQGKFVSEFVGNSMNSALTPDTFTDAIQELISDGSLSHDVQTNKETLEKAAEEIAKDGGIYRSVQKVKEVAQSGKVSAEDIAKAKLLYEQLTREID